ncbi:high light inducible protein [Synechococcus sp. CS-1325]|uniref:chlorophyll a/b-binding protein n=1 Tax=unclassified Synechococcus TaxID=2626047 RepID=UPI000DB6D092|nr:MULTISPECIES: chlorophyll a/b-binding protein [unclassified Synechococcus]PZV00832.1 MAG: high light inducible protein [Cyanobium sp.]MCT0200504.1 high light inducible protein [Synechococcus sp. CS-1325]MCT0213452.1 high light inducible protein [Synechococcus sp. CS-1326]MCT0231690.1 high light inducible protein [Synechococcus sp. CS-1324]MCT0232694.1 high light inducible protein [Synechococcus sp. CS-1327]
MKPVKTPAGSNDPAASSEPEQVRAKLPQDQPFGWSAYAERINGRFAMLGFTAVLVIEVLSRDTFLHWAGLVP